MKKLESKRFRNAFVASSVRRGIAYQMKALRGRKTQGQIGKLVGKPQNVISRLENPRYGKVNIQTLLDVAAAFDIGLLVRFVPFSKLLSELDNLSQEVLAPLSYDLENKASAPGFYKQRSDGISIRGTIQPHILAYRTIGADQTKVVQSSVKVKDYGRQPN